jgi:hypothetical protein
MQSNCLALQSYSLTEQPDYAAWPCSLVVQPHSLAVQPDRAAWVCSLAVQSNCLAVQPYSWSEQPE